MDRQGFKKLFDGYAQKLYNYALWIVRNRDACDDIFQSVFLKVWNQPALPGGEKEVVAWLYMVTRNQCMDHFRKQARFFRFRKRYAGETPRFSEGDPGSRFTWEMLGILNESERSILYMHIREGYSYGEIAETMETTENAVRVKAFRALKRLRNHFVKERI